MAYYIFCEVAWMKYYNGVTENDKPRNGGKFIDENGEGGEVDNFTPYNHKCYGCVMHYGNEMHLERLDSSKSLRNSPKIEDVTVIWVASNDSGSRIVGWYEHATMYRYWQDICDGEYDYFRNYNFEANEEDCYLIDTKDRTFIVPRAPQVGKGKGMGQSQVWYADSEYAQTVFIPKVQKYLNSVRGKCKPFWFSREALKATAKDKGQSTEELIKRSQELRNQSGTTVVDVLKLLNLAVKKDDCYETRLERGSYFCCHAYLEEAEEDLKMALQYEKGIEALSYLMSTERKLGHNYLAIEIGEKVRSRRKEDKFWSIDAMDLAWLYLGEGELAQAEALMNECELEQDGAKHKEWIAELREVLKEEKQSKKQ